uniref:RNase H type-1 domain-containing protein n=1 Tax=Cannabis sativa TaxID=3483 RepID=A0A803Q5W5_CANSA
MWRSLLLCFFLFWKMDHTTKNMSQALNLTGKEAIVHELPLDVGDNTQPITGYCLVFRVFTNRTIKMKWFEEAMRNAWITRAPIIFSEYGNGLFMVEFGCEGDMRRVHSIPFGMKSYSLAKMIGNEVGDFLEADRITIFKASSLFLRVRILVDVSKPITRGILIDSRNIHKEKWCNFKYENLPNIYFHCGMFDHTLTKCVSYLKKCDEMAYPPPLHYKIPLKAPAKSNFKHNLFDLSNSIPFDEIGLPTNTIDHNLAAAVSQYLTTKDLGDDYHYSNNPTGVTPVSVHCNTPVSASPTAAITVHVPHQDTSESDEEEERFTEKAKGKAIAGSKRPAFIPHSVMIGDSLKNILKRPRVGPLIAEVTSDAASSLVQAGSNTEAIDMILSVVDNSLSDQQYLLVDALFNGAEAGKEVLLKVVIQAIPSNVMSCFKLPVSICKKIKKLMAQFWWGSMGNSSKIHWKAWSYLCNSKFFGGLGFRSLIHHNQALLAKQAWRVFLHPNSLLSRILKARYFKFNTFLDAKKGHSPSFTWNSLLWGRDLLVKWLIWKVGDGSTIRTLHDIWIPIVKYLRYKGDHPPSKDRVSFFINQNSQWDLDKLTQFFDSDIVDNILQVAIGGATINFADGKLGLGVVINDWKGFVIAGLSIPITAKVNPLLAEALALKAGLLWCQNVHFPLAKVVSDSQLLVGKVNSKKMDLLAISDVVQDIRCSLSTFPTVVLIFLPRSFNVHAHDMAKATLGLEKEQIWRDISLDYCCNMN